MAVAEKVGQIDSRVEINKVFKLVDPALSLPAYPDNETTN